MRWRCNECHGQIQLTHYSPQIHTPVHIHKLTSYSQALLSIYFHKEFVYISPNIFVTIDKFISLVSF